MGANTVRIFSVSSVHIDNLEAGSDATEHLIGLGHQRIGIITGPLRSDQPERFAGSKKQWDVITCQPDCMSGKANLQ